MACEPRLLCLLGSWAFRHFQALSAILREENEAFASKRFFLQNLVMKFFPWNFSSFAVQSHGNLGLKFCWSFLCSEYPSKTRPKTSWKTSRQTSRKTSPRTAPLQNGNFAQNFALQKPIANICRQIQAKSGAKSGSFSHDFAWPAMISHDSVWSVWAQEPRNVSTDGKIYWVGR